MPTTQLQQFRVSFNHSEEFHRLKREIFTRHSYYFETDQEQPLIIDGGAHIGLATLYFKMLYPQARVLAFEPQPDNFALLQQNVADNLLSDVTLFPAALADQVGTRHLHFDATEEQWLSSASFLAGAWTGSQKTTSVAVSTLPLSQFLTEPISLLKLDTEGAEQMILQAAASKLKMVEQMKIEYHPHAGQSWQALRDLLEQQGFSLSLEKDGQSLRLDQPPRHLCMLTAER